MNGLVVKHPTVIHMLDGAVWRGTLEADLSEKPMGVAPDPPQADAEHFYFESSDGKKSGLIRFDAVKSISLVSEPGRESQCRLRFFDSAPIPSFLWIRATFLDGDTVEGMVSNQWSTFNAPLIRLSLPDRDLDQVQILIPRSSIAELRVITAR
ncbi:MAG TPA: hypothetical protein VMD58_11055 [Acidobacteriaceae bacterium]|nr:hypothetical protein [Acidobacteriaceae bacterium]